MANLDPRVKYCESRIAKIADTTSTAEEFPDCRDNIGMYWFSLYTKRSIFAEAQQLIESGEKAMRVRSYNEKPGLVKIRLPSVEDKVTSINQVMAVHLLDHLFHTDLPSHTDRLIKQNIQTLLRELPNGDNYRVTGNGRLVKKDSPQGMGAWRRGPPVSSGSERGSIGGRGRVLTDNGTA